MSARDLVMAAAGMSAGGLNVGDVFSAYTYTGTGSTKTVNNGIDLAGKGGMVWTKDRTNGFNHGVFDTTRGLSGALCTNLTNGNLGGALSSFNANGFTLNASTFNANANAANMASWTFRKTPKFFDVVTWNGNNAIGRVISHSLGIKPGLVIVKCTNTTGDWLTVARYSNGDQMRLKLNTTAATTGGNTDAGKQWTATTFSLAGVADGSSESAALVNATGNTYVAYLFAHDPEPTGVIQCGSFTADASGNAAVTLGWEPQYLLVKRTNAVDSWLVLDAARGLSSISSGPILLPNGASAELGAGSFIKTTATGMNGSALGAGIHYIYMAIRKPS